MIASGRTTSAHLGCECWFNLAATWAVKGEGIHRREHKLAEEHVRLLYADARCMLLRIEAPFLRADVLVGHAPHTGKSIGLRKAWWDQIANLLQS